MEEEKPAKINLWTTRRISRAAVLGALATAFSLIRVPGLPGRTLDLAVPTFAAIYYSPFEAYWCFVIARLIGYYGISNPGMLMINPFIIFMGNSCRMILVAWFLRRVRHPWGIAAAILGDILFCAFAIFPHVVIYYGWSLVPTVFRLQMFGALMEISLWIIVALAASTYMWMSRKQPVFPWRFIPKEEHFSVAGRTRTLLAAASVVVMAMITYGFCFTPYASTAVLGPPMSPVRRWADAWIRYPITFVLGWFFWELFKRNAEWFKQTE